MAENEAKLYIGNIPYSTKEEELKALFSQFGLLEELKIITDRFSGESRGFGFATYSSEEDAEKAIAELNGKEFQGKTLKVNVAREPSRDGRGAGGNRGPGGGRGGFGGGRGGPGRSGPPRGGNRGGYGGGNRSGGRGDDDSRGQY